MHHIRYAFATILTGVFGSMLAAVIVETANPVREWMYALPYPTLGLRNALSSIPILFVVVTISVGAFGLISFAILRREARITPAHLVAALAVVAFAGTAVYELMVGIPGGLSNWQASNAGGLTLAEGSITSLGWMSTFRRSVVAAGFAGLTGVVFLALALPRLPKRIVR